MTQGPVLRVKDYDLTLYMLWKRKGCAAHDVKKREKRIHA